MIVSNGSALNFAPQALGETIPALSNGYFYPGMGLSLSGRFSTYAALYKCQPALATVVDKVAAATARLTIRVWDNTPATGKVQDTTSPYARLIANPTTEMSPFAFWRWTQATYEVYGEAFWYKQRANVTRDTFGNVTQSGPVVNLLPMHPSRTAVHRDHDGNVEYIFTLGVASAGILHAPASDVVAFLRYNPDGLMRGLSRVEALRTTLLNEDAARRAMESFWQHGARPGLILKHPSTLSQPAQDRLRASADARHAGADNYGGTMVLEEGLDATLIPLNAEEAQYIESRKMNMQEVCMVFDVPPPVVHILDHATFSNITEQMRSMYRDTMAPRLEDLESVIDFSLRSEFFPAGARTATFALDEVLRGDFETRATAVVGLVSNGVMMPSEARPLFDLPDAGKVAAKLYANAALVELGTPAQRVSITEGATPTPAMAAEATDATDGAEAAAATAAAAGKAITRALMSRVGRKATTKDIRSGLVEGHKSELDKFFARQRESVKAAAGTKAAGVFDPSAWDGDLSTILHSLSEATAKAIGAKVAADLGGTYDGASIAEYLTSNSASTAKSINQTTADEIAAAFEAAADGEDPADTVDGVFDGEIAARSSQISLTRVAVVGSLAALVAARLSKARTKTWVVTSAKPRPSHSAMDGETVELNTPFSNGMNGPGDYSGGADEVAGCTCDLAFSTD